MTTHTENLNSITDTNQNFTKTAKSAEKNNSAAIFKNNAPRYERMKLKQAEEEQPIDNESLLSISRRIMQNNKKAYDVLAK